MENYSVNDSATGLISKLNNEGSATSQTVSGVQDVFIGRLVQDGSWAKQKDNVCPVDYGITYTFVLPDGVVARVQHGSATSSNIFNGGTFTFPTTAVSQRISFARYANNAVAELSVDDAEEMIGDGLIRVTYEDDDVITHNRDKEAMLAALTKLTYNENNDPSSEFWYEQAPLIAHTSDLHGDIQRAWNMMRYAAHYGIDECIVSGDATLWQKDGTSYVFAAAQAAGVHVCMAMGNHEAQGLTPSAGVMFTAHLADDASRLGYLKAENTVTDRGYYYHDIVAKKIRIIVLDQYDGGVYGGQGKGGRISQGQVDFLLAALGNTPEGYGVIVVMHAQEKAIPVPRPQEFAKFNTTTPKTGNGNDHYMYGNDGFYVDSSRPISKIIDAFISRGTYTGSWSGTYGGSSETITVDADFTEVDSSVEFICYLSGHIHTDNIGYLDGTANRQLMINITSGNGHVRGGSDYGFAGVDDIPRRGTGVTQDAFNVYAIDRANKQVRILRIGSNTKKDFTMRDWLIADYSPSAS